MSGQGLNTVRLLASSRVQDSDNEETQASGEAAGVIMGRLWPQDHTALHLPGH